MTPDPHLLRLVAVAAVSGFVGGLVGSTMMRSFALHLGIVNQPNPLVPQHTRPIAYLGGVGLGIGIAAGLGALAALGGEIPGMVVLVPAGLFLALGTADDLLRLSPAVKFALQGMVAALAVVLGLSVPFTGFAPLDASASWLWLMTMVNAFNLTDVCDGLLGSLAVVAFVALAALDPFGAPASLTVASACLGFLILNWPPARIFLGDAGSHLLGFLAGAFTLLAAVRGPVSPIATVGVGALLAGVPLFEMLFLVAVRIYKGRAWWLGSSDHFSLRLQSSGFTRARTDLIACGWAVAWGAVGLLLPRVSPVWVITLVFGVVASAGAAAGYLLRHEVAPPPRKGAAAAQTVKMVASRRGAPAAS